MYPCLLPLQSSQIHQPPGMLRGINNLYTLQFEITFVAHKLAACRGRPMCRPRWLTTEIICHPVCEMDFPTTSNIPQMFYLLNGMLIKRRLPFDCKHPLLIFSLCVLCVFAVNYLCFYVCLLTPPTPPTTAAATQAHNTDGRCARIQTPRRHLAKRRNLYPPPVPDCPTPTPGSRLVL